MYPEKIRIDRVIRSGRKTVALMVNDQAELVIRAPLWVSDELIEGLVIEKSDWIRNKQESVLRSIPAPRQFLPGEKFPFLGKEYPLDIGVNQKGSVHLTDRFIVDPGVSDIREGLINWYRKAAKKIIPVRCGHWSALTGLKPGSVHITSAQTRWGSCSSRSSLNFTWRLVMAPLEIVDYVVVHELVHLEIRNHSGSYWERVRSILPDYADKRRWLKDHGRELVL